MHAFIIVVAVCFSVFVSRNFFELLAFRLLGASVVSRIRGLLAVCVGLAVTLIGWSVGALFGASTSALELVFCWGVISYFQYILLLRRQ